MRWIGVFCDILGDLWTIIKLGPGGSVGPGSQGQNVPAAVTAMKRGKQVSN